MLLAHMEQSRTSGMGESIGPILITGATGGIGRAVSARLARAEHSLVLAARDEAKLAALCSELSNASSKTTCNWLAVDMASDQSVLRFADQIASQKLELGGAVMMPPQPPKTSDPLPSEDIWRQSFQESFIGPLALLRAAIAIMRPDPAAGKRCKIVIVSAISSTQVLANNPLSNVIRSAWLAEAKTLAFQYGERGIHVNTLSLGGTLSPWYVDRIKERAKAAGKSYEQFLNEETANIPLKKYGTPDEVAVAIEGLLSPFSDHLTGANIMHDGGFTRAY
jgi:3-oxoacyl-[acyl-carrier protein] reductase